MDDWAGLGDIVLSYIQTGAFIPVKPLTIIRALRPRGATSCRIGRRSSVSHTRFVAGAAVVALGREPGVVGRVGVG